MVESGATATIITTTYECYTLDGYHTATATARANSTSSYHSSSTTAYMISSTFLQF